MKEGVNITTTNTDVHLYSIGSPISDTVEMLPMVSLNELCMIQLVYLLLIVYHLTRHMKKYFPDGVKKHANLLKWIIIVYDFFQVMGNLLVILYVSMKPQLVKYAWEHLADCPTHVDSWEHRELLGLGTIWYYFKLFDLLDTLFFILRGKFSHVSVLQVYHHSTVVLTVWISLQYVPLSQNLFYAWINSLVHVVMYTYYGLALLKIRVWWKRYITCMQLTQFIIMSILTAYLLTCVLIHQRALYYTYLVSLQVLMFLSLFINFYMKAYGGVHKPKTH